MDNQIINDSVSHLIEITLKFLGNLKRKVNYLFSGMNPALVPQQKAVVNVAGGRIMGNTQMPIMQVPAPPGYHASTGEIFYYYMNHFYLYYQFTAN